MGRFDDAVAVAVALLSLRPDTDGNPGFNKLNGRNFGIVVTRGQEPPVQSAWLT